MWTSHADSILKKYTSPLLWGKGGSHSDLGLFSGGIGTDAFDLGLKLIIE